MASLKGIIQKEIGDDLIKFRFSNYTQLLFLKLLRENDASQEALSAFETRMYLFLAALQAADMGIETVEEVCELMDELSEDEQIKIFEEAGEYLDFVGKLALDLRVQYEHTQEHMRIMQEGRKAMAEIIAQETMETMTTTTLNSLETTSQENQNPNL